MAGVRPQSLKLANLKRINTKERRGKGMRPMLQAKFLDAAGLFINV